MSGATLLFDLDGTLVDTDAHHFTAFRETMSRYGIDVTLDFYKANIIGFPNTDIMLRLMPDHDVDTHIRVADEKEAHFRSIANDMEPLPGLVDLLDWAEDRGLPKGVVTNATRQNAELQLSAIGVQDRFSTVVIGYELARAKPDPLPYITGLERLGGHSGRSVAFEDSLSGLRAARAAGLPVVGLTTSLPGEVLLEEGAMIAVRDYTDPRLIPFLEAALGRS
ncbi:MAG: HAD-IA family hydrolase [Labrys sp. (in: a-proteobacteria)]